MNSRDNEVAKTGITADAFHQLLELAIEGRGKLPGAKKSAQQHLRQRRQKRPSQSMIPRRRSQSSPAASWQRSDR